MDTIVKLSLFVSVLIQTCELNGDSKSKQNQAPARRQAWKKQDAVETRLNASTKARTLPSRPDFDEACDNVLYYCLRAYKTGTLCARTKNWVYKTIDNYCMLEYINCEENYEVYQVAYMGDCLPDFKIVTGPNDMLAILIHAKLCVAKEKNKLFPSPQELKIQKLFGSLLGRRQHEFGDIDIGKLTEKQLLELQSQTAEPYAGIVWTNTMPSTKPRRTVPYRIKLDGDECDYTGFICLKAFKTGHVCGKTIYNKYFSFPNYCQLDYVNCRERFEMWTAAYMGKCLDVETMVSEDYELVQVRNKAAVVNSVINILPFEIHLPGYNYCGPGTKLQERLKQAVVGINPLDEACKAHDIAYAHNQLLEHRHTADVKLVSAAEKRWRESHDLNESLMALGVYNIMKFKMNSGKGVSLLTVITDTRKALKKQSEGKMKIKLLTFLHF